MCEFLQSAILQVFLVVLYLVRGGDIVKSNTYNKPDIKDLSYRLDERRDGYKIPIVSDFMFNVMLNNESRKQFICYFISSLLGAKYDEVLIVLGLLRIRLSLGRVKTLMERLILFVELIKK